VFCCAPYVQVSGVCMSGLCRPVHRVRACLGKSLARCGTGVRSPAAAHAENVHPWASMYSIRVRQCTPSASHTSGILGLAMLPSVSPQWRPCRSSPSR